MIGQVPVDELSDTQFEEISRLVKDLCGINLHSGKRQLVRARLTRRLRELGIPSFDDYLTHLRDDDGHEIVSLLDALSTNLTRFFREPIHFELLGERALSWHERGEQIRIWSAGCSSGEEPYSIAIQLHESLGPESLRDTRILATDLSTRVLSVAREGVYPAERLEGIDHTLISRHFTRLSIDGEPGYRVRDHLRGLITFARLNLMDPWPMRGPFSAILCRNVMIYFDKTTQQRLVERFWEILRPGGVLFIGHSESLTGVRHRFKYDRPTVYEKPLSESGMTP